MSRDTGVHHVAYTCHDLDATVHFYEDLVGLPLVHTEVKHLGDGFFRHVFFAIGDGSALAFFDLHGVGEEPDWSSDLNASTGAPGWANHLALGVDAARMEEVRGRMKAEGVPVVMEVDHGWCHSLYYADPDNLLVELCCDTPGFDPDADEAHRRLDSDADTDVSRFIGDTPDEIKALAELMG